MECVIRVAVVFTLLCLVHCQQTYPYVSFMDQNLTNHSYVDLSLVGNGRDGVQCHTDLDTCCSGSQGPHRGDWYFPNGTRLVLSMKGVELKELTFDEPVVLGQRVSIAVVFQLLMSMMLLTPR